MFNFGIVPLAALVLWAPVCLVAFALFRPPIACGILMLGGTMLLPVRAAFDLPSIPPLGREELTCIFILLAGLIRCRRRVLSAAPGRGLEVLVFILAAGSVVTAVTNTNSLAFGPVQLPGMTAKDGISDGIRDLLRYALPFFIGRAFYRNERDLKDLFLVVTIAGVLYTLPILVELRLSPQLHRWTYGYFQHGFHGTVRYGGYRPMVYMTSGLALSLFMATTCMTSASFTRAMRSIGHSGAIQGVPGSIRTAYLLVILVLCKSFGAIGFGILGTTLISTLRSRWLIRVALVITLLVAAYPIMRSTGTFPVTTLLNAVHAVDEERWDSLEFRFRNEGTLLDRAQERPLFGWGGFRRSRIFDQRGTDRSITDGYWIIMLGTRGALGLACTFGLILIPVLLAYRRLPSIASPATRTFIATLSLIVALHGLDLLPNGLFTYLPVFFSGALMGCIGQTPQQKTSRRKRRRARA